MQPHDYFRIRDTCPNAALFDVSELVMNDDVHASRPMTYCLLKSELGCNRECQFPAACSYLWKADGETRPSTRLLLYLSLAGFIFGLLNPSVAYARENDENSVCVSSGCHKGCFASKRRLSVIKNPARTSEEKSQKKTK